MSLYSRGARRALAALVAVSAFLSACVNDRGVAPESVVRRLPPRPQAALAPAGGATRGALLGEVSFTLPDTGAASGILTLIAPGTATGPVLIEAVGPIQLSNGTIPVTDALNPGAVMYFRSNGDLYVRYLTFGLFSLSSGGVRSYMPSPDLAAGDSVAMVDDSAAFHGITVIWETAQEEWSGLNASDPGFTHACPIMVSFICIVPPPFVAGNTSDVGPHGTIHIRAYAAQEGAPTIRILQVKGPNPGGSFIVKAGENRIDLVGRALPDSFASHVIWEVKDDPDDLVQTALPATAPTGAVANFLVPKQTTARWRAFSHPGTLNQKSLGYQITATLPLGALMVRSDALKVRQDEIDTMREEYVEWSQPRVPGRDEFVAQVPADPGVNTGDYAFMVSNPNFAAKLDTLRSKWTGTWRPNSVYRNPVHQILHLQQQRVSEHHYSCAADLQTYPYPRATHADSVRAERFWSDLRRLADSLGFIVEDRAGSGLGHVHVGTDCAR